MKHLLGCVVAFITIPLACVPTLHAEPYAFTTAAGAATLAGTADGTNYNARFTAPAGIALDVATNLYLTDGNALRKATLVGTNWVVTTLAGVVGTHGTTDATNTTALFDNPQGIAIGANGTIFLADTLNNSIRKVTLIGTNWVVTTIAGTTGRLNTGFIDGTNGVARFDHPYAITLDNGGTLYVADTENHSIRKVTPSGTNWIVTTIAGTNTFGALNGTNLSARFNKPAAIALDTLTNLYVSDFENSTIRKIQPIGTNWVVSTIAGLAGSTGAADGTNSTARFFQSQGITVDSTGRIYVADTGNGTIRKLTPIGTNWLVSTIGGLAGNQSYANGIGYSARFNYPAGVAVDKTGQVYVADTLNFIIRLGRIATVVEATLNNQQLKISWPVAATGYVLETKGSLVSGGTWLSLTNGISTIGDSYTFTTNTTAPAAFFRLRKP